MQRKSISEIEREYEFEIDKIVRTIRQQKARKVLLQFPDGLKLYSTIIADEIERRCKNEKLNVEIMIWLGSCYGACDVPIQTEKFVDLIVQFGHSAWTKLPQ